MSNNNIFSCERKVIDLNSQDMFSYESFNTIQKMADMEIDEKNQIIHPILMNIDEISRNRSMYEGTGYMRALASPYITELVRRGTLVGELEHPSANCSRERFMTVDDNNVCHKIIEFHQENPTTIRGTVQFLQPKGFIPWDWLMKGSNIAFSTRVLTPNYTEKKDENGEPYIYKYGEMRFVTWDCVKIPGFYKASTVDPDKYDASKEDWDGLKECHWTLGRKKEEFKNLLASQETLPMLEDIYKFSMKDVNNISYSKEGLITLNIDKTFAVKIPTNVYKVNQVLTAGND